MWGLLALNAHSTTVGYQLVPGEVPVFSSAADAWRHLIIYYCLAIDSTGLPAVTAIECALAHATQLTQQAAYRILAYFCNYPENILVLEACDMRLHTQSDASYCIRSHGRSVAGGITGNASRNNVPNKSLLSGTFLCAVLGTLRF